MAYYLSQVFVILAALAIAITYFMKKQSWICFFCSLSSLLFAVEYGLLGAWSGCASNIIAAIGYAIFYFYSKKNKQAPSLILMTLMIVLIATGCIDFSGYLSVMSICAGCIFIYSVWQKDNLTYKILNILTCGTFAVYNGLYRSWFGMAVEISLVIIDIVAVIRYAEIKKKSKKAETKEEISEKQEISK